MIYGIGIDVLKVDRIERVYGKHGERFVDHLLMPEEREQLLQTSRPVRFLAMRFAAKEAIVKGMGTGFAHPKPTSTSQNNHPIFRFNKSHSSILA